jgi:hypothetical protein
MYFIHKAEFSAYRPGNFFPIELYRPGRYIEGRRHDIYTRQMALEFLNSTKTANSFSLQLPETTNRGKAGRKVLLDMVQNSTEHFSGMLKVWWYFAGFMLVPESYGVFVLEFLNFKALEADRDDRIYTIWARRVDDVKQVADKSEAQGKLGFNF